jgi:hypothetical protein
MNDKIPAAAMRALAALLDAYPELRGLLRDGVDRLNDRPRLNVPATSGVCYRSPAWVCCRHDRPGMWYVRWTVPDSTKRNHRRYGWRSFGKGDEARAKAEAFHQAITPELARQWDEFVNSTGPAVD